MDEEGRKFDALSRITSTFAHSRMIAMSGACASSCSQFVMPRHVAIPNDDSHFGLANPIRPLPPHFSHGVG